MVFTAGVVVAGLAGTASAQNSPGSAALDTSLRGAVERKDVPGVVALITDRERVLYQSAFGVALTTRCLYSSFTQSCATTGHRLSSTGHWGGECPSSSGPPKTFGEHA
jgi:hypothetical protein